MKDTINTYFAVLIITVIGSGAAFLIVDIGTTDAIASTFGGTEAGYATLRQSISENR